MNILEIIKLSLANLFLNKFRSFLTMLGIIMGIASVILITSLGNGFRDKLLEDVSTDMNNFIFIIVDRKGEKLKKEEYLNDIDIKKLEQLPNISLVRTTYQEKVYDYTTDSLSTLNALDNNDFRLWDIKLLQGRYFTNKEQKERYSNKIMIDNITAKRLYKNQDPIGRDITLEIGKKKEIFKIIGVFKNYQAYIQSLVGISEPLYIVPKIVLESRAENNAYPLLISSVKNNKDIKTSIKNITNLLNYKTDKKDLYTVRAFSQSIGQFNKIFDSITLMISLIAGIALVVGGIGVMNIMLVSVTERITEIGLRKALGAKNKDIRNQFLIEASVLTLFGGVIGIFIGYGLALLIGLIPFLNLVPRIPIKVLIISLLISIFTGIFFGLYPAKKASKLTPMEALRKE